MQRTCLVLEMISHVVIALLLGASAILSVELSCSDLWDTLLEAGKLHSENKTTIKTQNFENSVDFIRSSKNEPTSERHVFAVLMSEESLPEVIVDLSNNLTYKADSLVITILDQTGRKAVLAVNFTSEESDEPSKDVVILVPLIAVVENDPNLNADFNSVFRNLSTLPEKGIYKDTFQWLQPLLSNGTKSTSWARQNATVFLTDCQSVVIDQYLMPAF